MNIGPLQPRNRFFLAPMAGYTCSSMRRVCVEHGAGLVYTEMVVAVHLIRSPKDQHWLLRHDPSERPIIAQLALAEADAARRATEIVNELGFDGVDLNLGCSVRRIVSAGMGAALAADLPRLRGVLCAMVKASGVPVTVKMRSGPDARTETAGEVARLSEGCGASAVAVHARTAGQAIRGEADLSVIARVKQSVGIGVIGNGGIRTAADALDMLRRTGCDAVMIARGALGNPWIFRRAAQLLAAGTLPPRPTAADVRRTMLRHYKLLVEEKGRHYANLLFRKQTSYYAKLTAHPRQLRRAIHNAAKDADLSTVIRQHVR